MKVKKSRVSMIVYYIVLTVMALMVVLPFIWLLSTSFDKVNTYSLPYPPRLFPKNWSLFNYRMALINVPIVKYLLNTIFLVVLSAVCNVFMSTLAGFCFSKGSFFGKSVLLLFVLSNMMVPFQAKLMPIYEVIRAVRLTDNYLGILLPSLMTNAMYIFFVKQFCDDLPSDMYEAGIVDGAGPFRIYFKIFLPLMGPIVATIIILDIIHVWNDLLWPMIVLTKQSLSTIQIGLIRYTSGSNGVVHAGVTTALSILSIIPLGIAFCFLQKYIVQSIASTGLKQ